ncbi:MAG: translesion error-prone DNA polymerase V autoproteolytic subunit [Gammaproteobacteria bacterium]|nr:translesion error-prone DNA polymerase V autoproteolytic subunit [Gammaproteobacteria bacterium]
MKISRISPSESLPLPFFGTSVPAGFPSPADDYIESGLDLNEYLVKHPSATFLARASGDSMTRAGILDGALLIVDKSITPKSGHVVIAAINGELTCKILDIEHRLLRAANPSYPSIALDDEMDLLIEGVVVHAINPMMKLA